MLFIERFKNLKFRKSENQSRTGVTNFLSGEKGSLKRFKLPEVALFVDGKSKQLDSRMVQFVYHEQSIETKYPLFHSSTRIV